MRLKLITVAIVILGTAGLGGLLAQQGEDQDAAMAAVIKAGTPGKYHAYMNVFEGSWDVSSKLWMDPAAPPTEEKASATYRWTMGRRYMEEKFEGTFGDMPFTGISIVGYDNVMKRYQSIWYDSMSTGIAVATGKVDETGKRFVYEGKTPNPMTGEMTPFRMIIEVENSDRFVFEYREPGPDGVERKTMEMVCTRRGLAGGNGGDKTGGSASPIR